MGVSERCLPSSVLGRRRNSEPTCPSCHPESRPEGVAGPCPAVPVLRTQGPAPQHLLACGDADLRCSGPSQSGPTCPQDRGVIEGTWARASPPGFRGGSSPHTVAVLEGTPGAQHALGQRCPHTLGQGLRARVLRDGPCFQALPGDRVPPLSPLCPGITPVSPDLERGEEGLASRPGPGLPAGLSGLPETTREGPAQARPERRAAAPRHTRRARGRGLGPSVQGGSLPRPVTRAVALS